MFTYTKLEKTSLEEFYSGVATQAAHLVEGEPNLIANLSNISALLNMHLADINWVGFYLWDDAANELVLGPFQGKPACIRIGYGKGVCGTAVMTGEPTVVPDVFEFEGHIACDPLSRSEVVVPLFKDGATVGVLDVDSPIPGRFSNDDAVGLKRVVQALGF